MAFDRLIRFVDQAGTTQYGNVEHELGDDTLEGKEVQLVSGNIESGFELLPERSIVQKACEMVSAVGIRLTEDADIISCRDFSLGALCRGQLSFSFTRDKGPPKRASVVILMDLVGSDRRFSSLLQRNLSSSPRHRTALQDHLRTFPFPLMLKASWTTKEN